MVLLFFLVIFEVRGILLFSILLKRKNRNYTKYECLFGLHERKALECEGDYFELLLFLSSSYDTRTTLSVFSFIISG